MQTNNTDNTNNADNADSADNANNTEDKTMQTMNADNADIADNKTFFLNKNLSLPHRAVSQSLRCLLFSPTNSAMFSPTNMPGLMGPGISRINF